MGLLVSLTGILALFLPDLVLDYRSRILIRVDKILSTYSASAIEVVFMFLYSSSWSRWSKQRWL